MTRLPLLVGACLVVAAVAGSGALAGPNEATTIDPSTADLATADPSTTDSSTADSATADLTTGEEPDDYVLVVENATSGERLLAVPVSEGTTVALNYTHSVEKTPVLDVYEVNGTELEMVRMEFHSYGAGLPARADVNVTENGTFVFDPEGSYEHLYVTPGRVAGHELIVGEQRFDLVALSNASTVKLAVVRRSVATTTYERLNTIQLVINCI